MPGCGTMSFSASEYFNANKLYAFDFIVIVSAGRIRESEAAIAIEAHKWKVRI
jgi:hypothetical protein